jgi:hypothetical protein
MYGMAIPLVILDIGLEIFHRVCFRLCHIPYVKRSRFIKIDRQKLSYLKWFEKLNCAYCGYANGLLQYAVAIGAETEKYWCGIMHAKYKDFKPPKHHKDFLPYGDEQAFRDFVKEKDTK